MKLARLKDRLVLALPDRGMPVILSCFNAHGGNLAGWETLAQRSNRVNGMDVAPPAAVYLPTGGMGHFVGKGFREEAVARMGHAAPCACGYRRGGVDPADMLVRDAVRNERGFGGLILPVINV